MKPLYLYNTLTRKKERFTPIQEGKVSLYVCGVTVYDDCHIGHARAYVAFDTIRRYLEYLGYDVTHVQNFTDIDDKIIERAKDKNQDIYALTETYIDHYFRDMSALNILNAHHYPKATDYIEQMQSLIATLIQKGRAYETSEGVYFSVTDDKNYGKLSHKVLADLIEGHRVAPSKVKKNPLDFILWKPSKAGEPVWDSPWIPGRPGWHTECSAMVRSELGDTIDIHGGGHDLIFPHHENEIAQSECATGSPLANYWLHNGFVTIKKEKMSKSAGNFFTIHEILSQVEGEVLRYYLQKVHYKAPLHFSFDGLEESKAALEKLYTTLRNIPDAPIPTSEKATFESLESKFHENMCDDINVSGALGALFELNHLINVHKCGSGKLKALANILGLLEKDPDLSHDIPETVTELAEKRKLAKKSKDYAAADSFRAEIESQGFLIEDTPDGYRLKAV